MSPLLDDLALQDFVDGEMPLAERQRVLRSIAVDDAAAWRRLALAFVEEQALRVAARSPVEGATKLPSSKLTSLDRATIEQARISVVSPRQPRGAVRSASPASGTTPVRRHAAPYRRQIAVLAATVLICSVAGFFFGRSSGPMGGSTFAGGRDGGGADLVKDDANSIASASDEATVRPVDFAIDPMLMEPFTTDMRFQMLQAGYLVDPRPVIMSVKLPSGQTKDIVVADPDVRFVGNRAYQ